MKKVIPFEKEHTRELQALDAKLKITAEVSKRYLEGATPLQIAQETNLPKKMVVDVIDTLALQEKAEEARKEIVAKALEGRLPQLQTAVAKSLEIWNTKCEQVLEDPENIRALTILEARHFISAASTVYEMSRLEEGKSTKNVVHASYSVDKVITAMKELSVIDPVFDYTPITEAGEEVKQEADGDDF